MKRTIQVVAIALLIAVACVAAAQDTATVTVSARVLGTCQFSAAGANLAFGDLPFDGTGTALGTSNATTLDFWCTNGAVYTITDDSGLYSTAPGSRRMQSAGLLPAQYIAYDLSYNPATGTGSGPGTPITLNINGTVGATYTANAPATYSDTVTLTINP